ncbi:hypothetical protein QVD17_19041 [Tagetes erecta]|uniref:Uncharacterized protein n=1 Tax=Tagetes erecta TaxID=13708 RepID=A0AAD8KIZ4_TARER|nr:hypothetical protein QVD17_19041 [Tagetes erecta]
MGLVGLAGSTPWRRMFDFGHRRSYREMCLEFLSTFSFTPPPCDPTSSIDRTTHIAVSFYLGGELRQFTFAGWATTLGFYTVEERLDPRFYTDEIESEPTPLAAWWPSISDKPPVRGIFRSTGIRDPLIRYLQRAIVGTINGRELGTEQMESPIVCGAYVTVIASYLGLHTDDYLVQQTAEAFPSIFGESTAIAMSMVGRFDDGIHWVTSDGAIWTPLVEGEDQHQHQHQQEDQSGTLEAKRWYISHGVTDLPPLPVIVPWVPTNHGVGDGHDGAGDGQDGAGDGQDGEGDEQHDD